MIISNKLIKDYYKKASQEGHCIYEKGDDEHLEILKVQYEANKALYPGSKSVYSEKETITMWFAIRELCKLLGVRVNWIRFKSPPEVLAYYAFMRVWDQKYICINYRFGKYEVDACVQDKDRNFILGTETQGEKVHTNREFQDAKKREYFMKQGLLVLQTPGKFLVNNFCEYVELLKRNLKEVYEESDVHFLKR